MEERDPDVIVVGGGPAGAVTALLLARRGLDVLILDRVPFPRRKPCGECLSPQATVILDRLGLLGEIMDLGPARLRGWRVVAPGGGSFVADFPPLATALAVERVRLDHALLQEALRAGARLRRVTVRDLLWEDGFVRGVVGRGGTGAEVRIRGRLVVGADGLRSVVARRSGLAMRPRGPGGGRRKISLTLHASRRLDAPVRETPRGLMLLGPGECLGIAPVAEGGEKLNLTLVVEEGRAPHLRSVGPLAFFRERWEAFGRIHGDSMTELGALDLQAENEVLASGPFQFGVRCAVADGVALVGDAAGYFDPFTGQGVFRALAGAELLAPVSAAALERGLPSARRLWPYGRAYARLVRWPRLLQRLIDFVVTRPSVADAVLPRLSRAHALADALVAVTGDLRPVHSLLGPRILADTLRGIRWGAARP